MQSALAWRDFMVSDYDDAGQVAWARGAGIEVVRGRGRLAGPGTVAVDGTAYPAEHVVIATGSDPAIPPVPGLRELPGLWTDREVTGPHRGPARGCSCSAAAPIGVEMAQAVSRIGAAVTIVERGDHLLPREPRRARGGRRGRAARRRHRAPVRPGSDGRPGGTARNTSWTSRTAPRPRGDRLLVATGRRPRVEDIGLETVGITPDPHGIAVDDRMSGGPGCGRSVTSPGSGS